MSNLGKCCASCAFVKRDSQYYIACHMDGYETVYYCKKKPSMAAMSSSKAFSLNSACEEWGPQNDGG